MNYIPTTPCAMFLFLKERRGQEVPEKARLAFYELRELKRLRNYHLGVTTLHGYNLLERYESKLEIERLNLVIKAEECNLRLLLDMIMDQELIPN